MRKQTPSEEPAAFARDEAQFRAAIDSLIFDGTITPWTSDDMRQQHHQRKYLINECVDRWKAEQQIRLRWISFLAIVRHYAQLPSLVMREDERRAQAYEWLREAIAEGEFDILSRTRVAFVQSGVSIFRMRRDHADKLVHTHGKKTAHSTYLANCWAPRELCKRWCDRRQIPWPAHFEPQPYVAKSAGPKAIARKRGPPATVTNAARDQMLRDLESGAIPAADLEQMKGLALAAQYGVSPNTAKNARKAALSEFPRTKP